MRRSRLLGCAPLAPWLGRPPLQRWTLTLIQVAFMAFPLVDAIVTPAAPGIKALMIAGAAAFVAGYTFMVATHERSDRAPALALVVMLALASALTIAVAPGWAFLFSYCAACAAVLRWVSLGFYAVGAATALAVLTPAIAPGGGTGDSLGFGAAAAGVGLMMLLVRDLRVRNAELIDARAELAGLAVARERERFARDLHDLLGHSLSVVALKADLAGRLLPGDPERARREVGDIEAVARAALGEVRDAVSGYRQPTLEVELEGARVALDAAGVACQVQRVAGELDPEAEAVLAWAVREGATNVIRHSGARRCTVRVQAAGDVASVEVLDDGSGGVWPGGDGHGLPGLRERVAQVRGSVAAGPMAGGGFRLAVTVPVAACHR